MPFVNYLTDLTKLSGKVFGVNVHHQFCDMGHVVNVKVEEVVVHKVAKAIIWCFWKNR